MRRRFYLAAGLTILLVSVCRAQESVPLVFIDMGQVSLAQSPLIVGEAVLVPLESAVDHLRGSVRWEPQLTAVVGYRGIQARLRPGDPFASLPARRIPLDIAPRFHAGLFFVTVRFFADALGAFVEWDAATNTLFLRSPPLPLDPRLRRPPKGGLMRVTVARVDLHRQPNRILIGEPGKLRAFFLTNTAQVFRVNVETNERTRIGLDRVYPGHLIRMFVLVSGNDPELSGFDVMVREATGMLRMLTSQEVALVDGRSFRLHEAARFFVNDTPVLGGTVLPGRRVVLRLNPVTGSVIEVVELD